MKHTIILNELNSEITYSVKDNSPRGVHTAYFKDLKVGDKIVIDNYFHEIIEPAQAPETVPETETHPTTETPVKPAQETEKKPRVSISKGNIKMGAIPSVSLPPVITCPEGCPCAKKCYALKMCKLRPNVRKSYQNNLDILNDNWSEYWRQVRKAVAMVKYFRFHVSGDIPNAGYLKEIVITARQNPGTRILCFTKRYSLVNTYIDTFGELPENLHLIFSEWGELKPDNPHNLPTAAVIFKGQEPAEGWKVCGGNCTKCACRGVGCWELKKGETIAFYEH